MAAHGTPSPSAQEVEAAVALIRGIQLEPDGWGPARSLRCPQCRAEHPAGGARRLFISASCPVCLEERAPFVALPCDHGVCAECFAALAAGGTPRGTQLPVPP